MPDRKYKTPNGSIVSETELKQKYGARFNDFVSSGKVEEVKESVYKTPNGKLETESVLREKYGDRFDELFSSQISTSKGVPAEQSGASDSRSADSSSSLDSTNTNTGAPKVNMEDIKKRIESSPLPSKLPKVDIQSQRDRDVRGEMIEAYEKPQKERFEKQLKKVDEQNQTALISNVKGEDFTKENIMTTDIFQKDYEQLGNRRSHRYTDRPDDFHIADSRIKEIYPEIDLYGFSQTDFENYVKQGNEAILKQYDAGYFTTDTTDLLLGKKGEMEIREKSKYDVLSGYVRDRVNYLQGKELGLRKQGKTDEADEVRNEILRNIDNFEKYSTKHFSNYLEAIEEQKLKNYKKYEKDSKQGKFRQSVNSVLNIIPDLTQGFLTGSGNVTASVLDLIGADEAAEYQRMLNNFNNEFNVSTNYGYFEGKEINYKGKKLGVSSSGQIVDLDTKTDITSIVDKLGFDAKNIYESAEKSDKEVSSLNYAGTVSQIANVVGDLGFQVAATRGIGGSLGVASRAGNTITSAIIQGGILSASVYEETLDQLRKANINDDAAKNEAGGLALEMGLFGTMTGLMSPNLSALGVTKKGVDKQLVKELAEGYVQDGKKGFTAKLLNYGKEKGLDFVKEGFPETLQEFSEDLMQKTGNQRINRRLGENTLETDTSREELVNLAIASFGASGVLASVFGQTRSSFADKVMIYNQLSNDYDSTVSIIDTYVNNGVMTEDAGEKMKKDILNFKQNVHRVPEDTPVDVLFDVIDLVAERNGLDAQKKNLDKAFHPRINEQIKTIDEKINELVYEKREEKTSEESRPTEDIEVTETKTEEGKTESSSKENIEKFSEISKVTEASLETEDGHTFNLDGTTYDEGGLVIPVVSKNMKQSELSAEAIQNFIDEHSDKIDGDSVKVGIYKFPNSDEVSIDLNIVAPNSKREEALAFAKEAGQESLFDLDTFENIKTGADGKNTKQFTAEEFKEISKRFSNEQNKTTNQTADETKVEGGTEERTDTGDDGDVSIDIKERYKQVADGIRQFKLKRPNGFDKLQSNVGTALLSAAWDGAVETIATTVELTGDIDAAIRKGVEYLKGTEWYKSLSKEGKEEAIKIFSQQTTDTFKSMADAHKPKSKKSTKAIVRQNTGQTDTSKKVVTTEAKALKEKLKAMQQASKLGAKAVQDLKKDFVDYVKAVTEDLKGVMTDAEVKTILNQVKNVTEKNIDRVSDVIDRLADRVERKQQLQEVSTLKKKVKKSGKSKSKLASLQRLSKDAGRINEKSLNDSDLKEYKSLLESIYNANRLVSHPDYKMVNIVKARETLEKLNEANEAAYIKKLEEQLGLEGLNLTKKELEAFKSSEDLDEFAENLANEKKKELLNKFLNIADYAKIGLGYVNTSSLKDEEKRQLEILKKVDLSKLSLQELKDFTRVVDNIIENSSFDGVRKIVNTIEAIKIADKIEKEADGKVIRPAKGLLDMITTNPFKKKVGNVTGFEKKFASRMFQHIDTSVRGLKGTELYKNIIHPISSAINNVDTVLTQNHIKHTYNLFRNAVDKNTNEFDLNKKIWMYLRQNETELNRESSTKKFFDVKDYVEAYVSKRGRDIADIKRVEKLLSDFTKKDGTIFTAEEMYNSFTPAQQRLVDQIKKDYAERTEAEKFHNENYDNKSLEYFEGYAPIRVVQRKNKKEDPSDSFTGKPRLTTDSSFDRTANKAQITDMDALKDYESYIKDSYYKTEVVSVYNKVIKTAQKLSEKKGELGNLGEAIETVIDAQIQLNRNRAYRSSNAIGKIFSRFVKNTFSKVLIKPSRMVVEGGVNWGTFLLTHPEMAASVFQRKVAGMDKEFMQVFAKNFNSTHSSRIGASSVDKRFVESSPFDQFKIGNSETSLVERISDLYNNNKMNQVNDWITEKYYKYSDPTVFAWKNYLLSEFKNETGKDLDVEKFKTDSKYRESIKEDLNKVLPMVDKRATRIGNTGAVSEQKLDAQKRRGKLEGMIQDFMKSFGYNENSEIRDAFHGMLGNQEATTYKSKVEAMKMFTMLNIRSLTYGYGMQMVASSLASLLTGKDIEDDEYEKMLKRTFGQHGMLVLLGNRNATWNIGAAIIFEMINKGVVQSSGDKKYNPYEDGVFFSPTEKGSLSQYLTMGGSGGAAVKVLYDGALTVEKLVTEGDNLSAYQQAKANRVFLDFFSQATGSGLVNEISRYNYEIERAAGEKPKRKTIEEIRKELGLE